MKLCKLIKNDGTFIFLYNECPMPDFRIFTPQGMKYFYLYELNALYEKGQLVNRYIYKECPKE